MNKTTKIHEVEKPKTAMGIMAARCSVDPIKLHDTLKNTVFKKATDEELLALVVTANVYELNPLLKEMYAFPAKGGGIVPVVGFDGWMKIINRQPNFDGLRVRFSDDGKEATCKIYLKDRSHPVEVTEYLDECKRNTEPWNTMPKRMLRHKVIMQAGRVAFGIGGIQDEDEAHDTMRNVTKSKSRVEVRDDYQPPNGSEPQQNTVDVSSESVDPNPDKSPAQGRQKKDRYHRDCIIKSIKGHQSESSNDFWWITIDVGQRSVDLITFSSTLSERVAVDLGKKAKVTFTLGAKGVYQMEDYKLLEIEQEGGLI